MNRYFSLIISLVYGLSCQFVHALLAQDDELYVNFDVSSSLPLDLLRNDSGTGKLTITRVGEADSVGADGGFWTPLSSGGFVWVTPEGFAVFFPQKGFDKLAFGLSAETSVAYTIQDKTGKKKQAWLRVTVANRPQRDTPTFINYHARSPAFNLLENDASRADLTIEKVNNKPANQSGFFWVEGSNGGHFQINREGEAFFFHEGRFSSTPIGSVSTSSVYYTVSHRDGGAAKAELRAHITNTGTEKQRAGYRKGEPNRLEHPGKVGIGGGWLDPTKDRKAQIMASNGVLKYFNTLRASWYYNWGPLSTPGKTKMEFVPMTWGKDDYYFNENLSTAASYRTILAFNEPDHPRQSAVGVGKAIELWPKLMQTGARLGAPATANQVLDDESWFARFMASAAARNFDVDFIPIHFYSSDADSAAFEAYLIAVYEKYRLPIWVTEFGLADFGRPRNSPAFSFAENADFLQRSFLMLDDLPFVERHAWFTPMEGGDGWNLNTHFVDRQERSTPVGRAYEKLLSAKGKPIEFRERIIEIPGVRQTGLEYLVHKPTSAKASSCDFDIGSTVSSVANNAYWDCVKWERKWRKDGSFHILHRFSDHLLAPQNQQDEAKIVLHSNIWNTEQTRWLFRETGDGFGRLVHKESGKFLFLSGQGKNLELQPNSWEGDYTRWKFESAE